MSEPTTLDTPERRSPWSLRVLTGATTLQFALVFLQGVTAGNMLTGNTPFLQAHEFLGTQVLNVVAVMQVVSAIVLRARQHGPTWPILAAVATLGLLIVQGLLGFDGRLALHIPNALGILIGQPAIIIGLQRSAPPLRVRSRDRPS